MRTKFWKDKWCGDRPQEAVFPFYSYCLDKGGMGNGFMKYGVCWNPIFSAALMIGSWMRLGALSIGLERRKLSTEWRTQSNGQGLRMACFLLRLCT